MGPKDTYDVLTTKLTVPKLASDGLTWALYQECIINTIMSKKLCQHVVGTAHKPVALVECDGSFFLDDNLLFLLLDKQLEEHEEVMEDWLQKEAMVPDIIYITVDQSTFHQTKEETTTTAIWKKLTSIHGNRDAMFETDLLAQLQNSHFIKNSEVMMHNHLTNLVILMECLNEINCPLSNTSFASYICTSLSLTPSNKPLLTMLTTNAHVTRKPIPS
ncbi:hypothetical protein C0989_004396 [Termitomyces sp. Mn162]|nr:hypothetical protein C0989_004396 [Termitomyces sp. Mn162]